MLRFLGLSLLVFALLGCGQKGDLYLPQAKNPGVQNANASSSSLSASSKARTAQ